MIQFFQEDIEYAATLDDVCSVDHENYRSDPLILIFNTAYEFQFSDGIYDGDHFAFSATVEESGMEINELQAICFTVIPIPEPGAHYILTQEQKKELNEVLNRVSAL